MFTLLLVMISIRYNRHFDGLYLFTGSLDGCGIFMTFFILLMVLN